jgi:hypothetical protein
MYDELQTVDDCCPTPKPQFGLTVVHGGDTYSSLEKLLRRDFSHGFAVTGISERIDKIAIDTGRGCDAQLLESIHEAVNWSRMQFSRRGLFRCLCLSRNFMAFPEIPVCRGERHRRTAMRISIAKGWHVQIRFSPRPSLRRSYRDNCQHHSQRQYCVSDNINIQWLVPRLFLVSSRCGEQRGHGKRLI